MKILITKQYGQVRILNVQFNMKLNKIQSILSSINKGSQSQRSGENLLEKEEGLIVEQ